MSRTKKQEPVQHDDTTDGFARMVKDAQGSMRGYQMSPEMRAVAERCRQPRMIGMASSVTDEAEGKRRVGR